MTRRRNYRNQILSVVFIFAAISSFFFIKNLNQTQNTNAYSLDNFDPGFIISDYVMGDYNSMTEQEIQDFLTSKNSCSNTNYEYYEYLSSNPKYKWHWKDDHFVCLSEELFGDGEIIGEGDTAAHIIWQAAQDFQINPKVLIVLLEKETSLITDRIPNDGDYRKATGYGCPDTAACSEKYYGFKNQVRSAASLFHTVLSGGWTNYPLGVNYIQYNPNKDCGGSEVNIRSLATSALYRYTPYQPNEGALAAGYGTTTTCGAYGNRNFYLYFQDWFGGITDEMGAVYSSMVIPRTLYIKEGSQYYNSTMKRIETKEHSSFEYFAFLNHYGEQLCLSIKDGGDCYVYEDLEEIVSDTIKEMDIPRMLIGGSQTVSAINIEDGQTKTWKDKGIYTHKTQINGNLCVMTKEMMEQKNCVLYTELNELNPVEYTSMVVPRKMYLKEGSIVVNTKTGVSEEQLSGGKRFFGKKTEWFGDLCIQIDKDQCVLYAGNILELRSYSKEDMTIPRSLRVAKSTKIYDLALQDYVDANVKEGDILYFDTKAYHDGNLCLGSTVEKIMDQDQCILYDDLEEIPQFEKMAVPRELKVDKSTYYDIAQKQETHIGQDGSDIYFTSKTVLDDGELCLRTKQDEEKGKWTCIRYSSLSEK